MAEQDERRKDVEAGWVRPVHQSRSRAQRDRLLKAGERVFAAKGFWQAHVSDIVAQADCSVGSFYRRFKDKEALFFALQEDMAAHAQRNLEAVFDDPRWLTEPLLENMVRLMRNTARTMQGIEGYYRALFEMSLRGHDVWTPMRSLELYQAERMVAVLNQRGVETTDDTITSAHMVIRMVHGLIISTIIHEPGPYGPGDPKFHRELAELCLAHLTARPGDGAGSGAGQA
ncbi:TetR/AcrR family transcriptional regulator [Phenylobacterium sp. VNQ135]|uniref:TetR/AcrR family transcriptional regulator n=1 Tax=Phenylobacterium sp. VNQ135 TaxID=3400922 RepID=UPI003C122ACD